MSTTLLVSGRILASGATAMAVRDGVVVWVGGDEEARTRFDGADEVLECRGALVAPAFVDAHVHATSTGLLASGLDLTGCASLADCLDTVAGHPAAYPGSVLWGHGWDETSWPERRPRCRGSRRARRSR